MDSIFWNQLYYDYLSKYKVFEAKQIYILLLLPM